jgi:hypothetical protein
MPSTEFEDALRSSYAKSPKAFGRYFLKPNLTELQGYYHLYGVNDPHAVCYMILNGLTVPPSCPGCGSYRAFERLCRGFHETCLSKACMNKVRVARTEATVLEQTGATHHWKTEASKQKQKETMLERYGVDHNSKGTLREDYKKTMLERYGVDSPLKSSEIQARQAATSLERHGSLDFFRSESAMRTLREKHGVEVDNVMKIPSIAKRCKEQSILGKLEELVRKLSEEDLILVSEDKPRYRIRVQCKCGKSFELNRGGFMARYKRKIKSCWSCHPEFAPMKGSAGERAVLAFVESVYSGKVMHGSKSTLKGYELDLFFPDMGFAIEFNGLHWHSDTHVADDYHVEKSRKAREAGINLLHIWEDNWSQRPEVVKSTILNKLGLSKKIYARECELFSPTNAERKAFMIANHLDGDVPARVTIGLSHQGIPVAMASFGPSRFDHTSEWEVMRSAVATGLSVVGGFSRMMKKFENDHSPSSICSYRKLDLGAGGGAYLAAGFSLAGTTRPNYYYHDNGSRLSRLAFTKARLVADGHDPLKTEREIMSDLGYERVYDCGSEVYKKTCGNT